MIRATAALLFLFLLGGCNGILNLYLSTDEVQKLLGLEAELFYVRDGIVNNYALNFIVPIPSKLNLIHFTWESLANRPLPYSIEVNVSNHKAIAYPELNISRTGFVPVAKQVFSCSLPCLGLANADVNVVIGINVTVAPGNVTNLQLRRKKICLQTEPSSTGQVVVNPIPLRSNSARIFYYALTCAAVLILTSVTCVVALYMKNNKHRKTVEETSNQSYTTFLPSTIRNQTSPTPYSNFSRQLPTYSFIEDRPSSKSLPEKIKELTADRCRVCLINVMLEGTFSRVYQGTYTTESGSNTEVLVKTVTDHASQVQISLLLQEGTSFFSLNHPNLLSILGISFEDNKAPFLLYPVQNSNNLKLFLQKCKLCSEGVAHTLTTQEVVDMALQVIEALLYLHSKRILHKDLAARNCMVSSSLKIRVTDNALSRDLFPSDYHCLGDNENRSVKWLAIESLINKTFSTQSDVWSFGVLLWELTTLAQQPYVEIDPFEMEAYLKDGYRLSQPINCPDELFAVMAYCWAMNPDERPTFLQLQVCLKEFYAQLTRYV